VRGGMTVALAPVSYDVATGPAARTPAESPQSPDAPEARET
jgi:hypothetical protein